MHRGRRALDGANPLEQVVVVGERRHAGVCAHLQPSARVGTSATCHQLHQLLLQPVSKSVPDDDAMQTKFESDAHPATPLRDAVALAGLVRFCRGLLGGGGGGGVGASARLGLRAASVPDRALHVEAR